MNRLQKKCVIVTVGVHLLLLVILMVGPAFFSPRPKADDSPVIDVIPANLIDAPFNSGVANAQPPPPTPPQPLPPAPVVTPPAPVPPKEEPPKPVVKETEREPTPLEKPKEVYKPQVNTKLVTRNAPKNSPTADNSQQQQRQVRAIRSALRNLKSNLTSATTIDMPGNSSVAYASYGTVVVSVYRHAWVPPDGMATDNVMMKFSVNIANDGTVFPHASPSPRATQMWTLRFNICWTGLRS